MFFTAQSQTSDTGANFKKNKQFQNFLKHLYQNATIMRRFIQPMYKRVQYLNIVF